jgi:hypothetical protein
MFLPSCIEKVLGREIFGRVWNQRLVAFLFENFVKWDLFGEVSLKQNATKLYLIQVGYEGITWIEIARNRT